MKCGKTAVVLLLVLGVWSCNAYAAWGYSWIGGSIYPGSGAEDLEGLETLGAYAFLLTGNGESEESTSDPWYTWAEVYDASSYGYAEVDLENGGAAEAYADTWDGSYTKAIGRALAQFDFVVDTADDLGSELAVDIDCDYEFGAAADEPGSWARADVALSVLLKNVTTGEESVFEFADHTDVGAGESDYLWDFTTGSVSLFFNEGDQGLFRIEAYAFAEASTMPSVPVPGAMLLGSLGLGLVGWLRRRHAL